MSWIFLPMFSQNCIGDFWNFELWMFNYLFIFFFENFNFAVVACSEIKNLKYLGNERSQSKTEWIVGLMGSSSTYIGYMYLWRCIVQGHFGVIRCPWDYSENTIKKNYFLYRSQLKFIKFFLNYLLNHYGSNKNTFGIFESLKTEILEIFFPFR